MAKKTKREIALANKRRGKAYQTKLAQMVDGRNIGTLGGEDVEHCDYSFEAKTRQQGSILEKKMLEAERYLEGEVVVCSWVLLENSGVCSELSMLRYINFEHIGSVKLFEYVILDKRSTALTMFKQCRHNSPEGRIPVVVCHILNRRHEQDLVILLKRDLNIVINSIGSGEPLPVRRLMDYLTLKKEQDYGRKSSAK